MDKTNTGRFTPETRVVETVTIGISGMTCDNCVRRVEKTLRSLPGVREVKVDRGTAAAKVTFDSSVVNVPVLHDALLKSGYKPV